MKVSDFGLSRILDSDNFKMKTMCGTLDYVGINYFSFHLFFKSDNIIFLKKAPEVLANDGTGYGPEVDIWSLGVMVFVMFANF